MTSKHLQLTSKAVFRWLSSLIINNKYDSDLPQEDLLALEKWESNWLNHSIYNLPYLKQNSLMYIFQIWSLAIWHWYMYSNLTKTLFSMPYLNVKGVQVSFPFEPYQCQVTYMEKVMECLQTVSQWNLILRF